MKFGTIKIRNIKKKQKQNTNEKFPQPSTLTKQSDSPMTNKPKKQSKIK